MISPVNDLYVLVVCGGKSTRMGTDKGLLMYHQKPQRYHLYDMLLPLCEKVFISCNASQVDEIDKTYTVLPDLQIYSGIGPMAALLTAYKTFPWKNILLIGCDYPFLTPEEINDFVVASCGKENSAAFYNEANDLYEPLLAYYHYSNCSIIYDKYEAGQYSLQHHLKNIHALKYYTADKKMINSIDTMKDFLKAKQLL